MADKITLYSAWYCPFAQRTWATLEYLGLPYVYVETDPYDKTDHWLEISRGTGQVPVLEIQIPDQATTRIPDSLRTLEYLDDAHSTGGTLYGTSTVERAETRFWLDQQSKEIIPYFYQFLKAGNGSAAADQARERMVAGLETFAQALSPSGPFFFGNQPGALDFAFAPFAYRIELLLAHYKGFELPRSGEIWPRYQAWLQAMKTHSSFTATMPQSENYETQLLEFYLPYSQGGGQKDVTQAA